MQVTRLSAFANSGEAGCPGDAVSGARMGPIGAASARPAGRRFVARRRALRRSAVGRPAPRPRRAHSLLDGCRTRGRRARVPARVADGCGAETRRDPIGSPPAPHRYKRTTSSQLRLPVAGMLDGFRRLAETRIVVNPTGRRRRGTLKEIGSSCLSTMIGGNDPSETSASAGLRARLGPVGSAREPTGPPFFQPSRFPTEHTGSPIGLNNGATWE